MMMSGWPNVGLRQLGKMGVRYVRGDEEGWTPVVRRKRKKSAGYVGDGELGVDGGSVISGA